MKITRPTDLKSICLTSRDCRDVAVRELYRKVFLDIGGAKAVRISGFLARENPGLPHVRDITVYFCISGSDDREVLCRQANFVVRLLLELLPPNILEAFRSVSYNIVLAHVHEMPADGERGSISLRRTSYFSTRSRSVYNT